MRRRSVDRPERLPQVDTRRRTRRRRRSPEQPKLFRSRAGGRRAIAAGPRRDPGGSCVWGRRQAHRGLHLRTRSRSATATVASRLARQITRPRNGQHGCSGQQLRHRVSRTVPDDATSHAHGPRSMSSVLSANLGGWAMTASVCWHARSVVGDSWRSHEMATALQFGCCGYRFDDWGTTAGSLAHPTTMNGRLR
jgi:hypothetical protein